LVLGVISHIPVNWGLDLAGFYLPIRERKEFSIFINRNSSFEILCSNYLKPFQSIISTNRPTTSFHQFIYSYGHHSSWKFKIKLFYVSGIHSSPYHSSHKMEMGSSDILHQCSIQIFQIQIHPNFIKTTRTNSILFSSSFLFFSFLLFSLQQRKNRK